MTLRTNTSAFARDLPVNNINLPDVVGRGYGTFWRFRGRYRVVKGSRRSKKSKTTALDYITKMMQYPWANTLVVRKTFRTLKDSCYTELKWAIRRLGVEQWWTCKESPLEMTYTPTGQKIYFRGLDDPLKVTSITTEVGVLSWLWVEEAYEITSEEDFDTLTESLMGDLPEGAYRQITLTFNPWSDRTWIRKRFFCDLVGYDNERKPIYKERENIISDDGEILAMTTNYMCNEWLSAADIREFERMKERNPRRYNVAGLGNWGIVDGLVYERWREEAFDHTSKAFMQTNPKLETAFGLDFGYSVDATAFVVAYINQEDHRIYIYDELYKTRMSNRMIFEEISKMGYAKERIIADSAEPKSIDELKGLGLRRIEAANKGKDSISSGIQFLQNFEIIIHPRCVNFLTEISNYTWDKDKFGNQINKPIDDFNHCLDALRYGCERYAFKNKWII